MSTKRTTANGDTIDIKKRKNAKPASNTNATTPSVNSNHSPSSSTANGDTANNHNNDVAFMPDDEIGNSFIFKLLYYIFLTPLWCRFWAYSGEGWDRVREYSKQGKGVFLLTRYFIVYPCIYLFI